MPKFNLIFHDSNKKYLFSKHQNKAEFRNLDDIVVIRSDFPGLRTFAILNDLYSLNNLSGLKALDSLISSKKLLILMVRSSLPPKWSKPVPFSGMDHQKSIFYWYLVLFSFGGCWGQPMLLFWKLVDETQMSHPPEPTRHHKSSKSLIFLPSKPFSFVHFNMINPVLSNREKSSITEQF